MDRHLGGVGSGDQVGRAEEIEECLAGHPAAARDDFLFHHGDVDGRPAHRGAAKLQKQKRKFPESVFPRIGRNVFREWRNHHLGKNTSNQR